MASVMKISDTHSINNIIRHCAREVMNSSNVDIDTDQTEKNYSLAGKETAKEAYQAFKERLNEVFCYKRANTVKMGGWIITAPTDLAPERYREFFGKVNDFMTQRYGANNVIQSTVHMDEATPHLHFNFIPTVKCDAHEGFTEKLCAKEVISKTELRNFHPELQNYLNKNGLSDAHVHTGITKAQGGNRTVREMKADREREREIMPEWGSIKNWGKERTHEHTISR